MRPTRLLSAMAIAAVMSGPALSFGSSGSYLAARHASFGNDFVRAAEYYTRALALDVSNPALMENAMASNVSLGYVDRALPIAQRMIDGEIRSQLARMVVLTGHVKAGDYADVLSLDAERDSVGALVDGLVRAWAMLGDGQAAPAMAAFDAAAENDGLRSFALYHKALALASVGDLEGADEILAGRTEGGPLSVSRRGVVAHAQILSQLDRGDDAAELIAASFGPNPAPIFEALQERLEAGETLDYDVATDARQGIAEVFHSVGGALLGEAAPGYTLVFSRLAEHLHPGHVDAVLMSASLLEELEQYDLATRAYDRVPVDDPAFVAAELGRADALLAAERNDRAIEVLTQLSRDNPALLQVQMRLGDTLRRLDRYAEAATAYDAAIALIGEPERQHWAVYFARGIAFERTDRWPEAEADFERALELQPDQPQVLNYLGYSLVEMQIKLDEALDMIERAVAARPDDGYITDSLGWVLFRMGRYDEAVEHLERAAELMPVDPIINDHLGDGYWAVGRYLEARFQWRRALSFDPEPDEAERIRQKLEIGLDAVLLAEGADPIAIARDDG